ncbi:hypothetical protein M8J75_011160 [Diaphorina citri]|nr:hypothetical protein M8J75_011160 [Diaphorina citri]
MHLNQHLCAQENEDFGGSPCYFELHGAWRPRGTRASDWCTLVGDLHLSRPSKTLVIVPVDRSANILPSIIHVTPYTLFSSVVLG